MSKARVLRDAFATTLLRKHLTKTLLENEVLKRENILLKQQLRLYKGGRAGGSSD
ncbi:hypothetical protein [Halalkalibacter oceani]|uniref:hypothetical protein n=1 Tax=Halalkalibacter oceani TaxID=1653776 RepID=UPI0033954A37